MGNGPSKEKRNTGRYGSTKTKCPEPGNILVRVAEMPSDNPVLGIKVRISGPANQIGVTKGLYGQYLFLGVPPGEYTVEVLTEDHPKYSGAAVGPDHPRTIDVEAGDFVPVVFVLALHCSVQVKVLKSSDMQPLRNSLIDVTGLSQGTSTVPQGKWETVTKAWQSPKFAPGKYRLTGALPDDLAGYELPPSRDVVIKPGSNPLVVILVEPCPIVVVKVTNDYDNRGVDDVVVTITGPVEDRVDTAHGGLARSKPLKAGKGYRVQISVKQDKIPLYRDMPPITQEFELVAGQVENREFVITPKILELTSVDPWFAPSKETNTFTYKIHGLWDQLVTLTVKSDQYASALLYTLDLDNPQKANGAGKTILWDGLSTAAGTLQNQYVHPLLSPFKVKLAHSGQLQSEKEFKVLYHSISLHQGPWVADQPPQKAALNKWVRYQLNRLGYYGGPVETDTQGYMDKAIVRYKANHKSMVKLDYSQYNATADNTFQDALDAFDNQVEFLTGDAITNAGGTSKVFVEALTYQMDGVTNEFDAAKKHEKEAARLNRPLIPIEVSILLKSKEGKAIRAPKAVGPCRVSWRFTDPQEVLTPQFTTSATEPSYTKEFIEKALQAHGGRLGASKNNCHADFGGIRGADDEYHAAPFLLGDFYTPYTVQRDDVQKVVYSLACVDPLYPKRTGRAGIFFRPSIIAGDQYKLSAEIDFTNLPNQNLLEGFHNVTSVQTRIRKDTGTFVIWRKNAVVKQINWPPRAHPPAVFASLDWAKVKTEYEKAFHDIQIRPMETSAIDEVINQEEYRDAACAVHTTLVRNTVTLHNDTVYGLDLPAQGGLDPDQYSTAISTKAKEEFWDGVSRELRKTISKKVRKTLPNGFVAVDFLSHKPVTIYDTKALPPDQPTAVSATRPGVVSVTMTPNPPAPNAAATFSIAGTGFAGDAIVIFHKDGSEITVANDQLTSKTATLLAGPVTLAGGNYRVSVKNIIATERSPGIELKVPTHKDYVSWTFSVGLPDSVIYIDQKDPDFTYFVLAHEMGHNLFLQHWENTSNPTGPDHDQGDHNCLMSYSSKTSSMDFQRPGIYTPHFCGKCNLKLRGWDVTHVGVPKINPITRALLVVSIVVSNASPNILEEFDVTISVRNDGPGDVHALNLQIGGSRGDKDLVSTTANGSTFTQGTGVWDIGDLANGASKALVFRVKPRPNAAGKTIEFKSSFKAATETPLAVNKAEASAKVKDAELKLTLTPAKLNPELDEEVEVDLKVANGGPDDATNVKVELTIPAEVQLLDGNLGGSLAVVSKTWTIGALAKNAEATGKIKLKPTTGAGGTGRNCVGEVKATEGGKTATDRRGTFDLTIQASARLTVSLSAAQVNVAANNESGPVTLTIRNDGPEQATGVALTFSSSNFKFRTSNASQGNATADSTQYQPFSGNWDVGALNSGAQATLICRVRPTKKGAQSLQFYASADQMNAQSTSNITLAVLAT
jgi:hypothetical protein